jgi:outer membrane lipoprotein-sorting protein
MLKLFGFALLLMGATVKAQTADELINKHITAIGGKDVIKSIKSQIVESNLSVMGSDLTSVSYLLVGKGFKNVANFNGQEIIQVITPTSGWMINPLAGQTDPTPLPEDQVKGATGVLEVGGDLIDYAAKGSKVELAGKEKIEGIDAFKIKLTNKDGKESFYFIDPATYYVVKRESTASMNGQDLVTSAVFSNFKKTDIGYVIPYTTVSNQGFEMTINVSKVEFNKEIDPKIFDMPK